MPVGLSGPPSASAAERPGSNTSSSTSMKRKLAPGHHRRTHTKSRHGCQMCKRRKVKCGEERPTCIACQLRNTPCVYPDATTTGTATTSAGPRVASSVLPPPRIRAAAVRILPLPAAATTDTPSDLHLADLRLLHHFLTTCYPHLPAGNESIWTSAVPVLAASRPYLMHALLALAATHLGLLRQYNREADCGVVISSSPESASASASKTMTHRAHALEGLHLALAAGEWSRDDVDAMLAAAYVLTFQASFMADGLVDFVTMVRGCALITRQIGAIGRGSRFGLGPMAHVDVLEETLREARRIEARWIEKGVKGLEGVRRRMEVEETEDGRGERGGVEWMFLSAVEVAMRACGVSAREGYVEFCRAYGVWYESDATWFERLVDPKNEVCRVLMAFFLGLELLMSPVFGGWYDSEKRMRDVIGLRVVCVAGWLRGIEEGLSAEWRTAVKWPMDVGRAIDAGARAWVKGGSAEGFVNGALWQDGSAQRSGGSVGMSEREVVVGIDGTFGGSMYPTPEEELR